MIIDLGPSLGPKFHHWIIEHSLFIELPFLKQGMVVARIINVILLFLEIDFFCSKGSEGASQTYPQQRRTGPIGSSFSTIEIGKSSRNIPSTTLYR